MDGTDLLSAHADPVVQYGLTDAGVVVRRVNDAFEATFGVTQESEAVTLGGTLVADAAVTDVAEAIEAGERLDRDLECDTADGVETYRVRNLPADDEGFLVYTDLGEDEADALRSRVAALEERNEQLESFASVVSHDLRNPIDVAETYVAAARSDPSTEHLDRIEDALSRMRTLIDDVLNLAREGQVVDDVDRVTLADVAEDAWAQVDSDAASLSVETSAATLRADPSRLQQCLENLFRNAREHGGDTVAIRVTATDGNGFAVADDGPGIPAADRDDIFDPGVTSGDGTGLGLAIVERIADAHDWTVAVEASERGGARFVFADVDSFDTI
jgi:signal transduction histidine kinase